MRGMRTAGTVFALSLALAAAVPAHAAGPYITARAAVIMDAGTGEVVWERNSTDPLPPASTTKVMTAILALESGRLDESFRVSEYAAGTAPSGIPLRAPLLRRRREARGPRAHHRAPRRAGPVERRPATVRVRLRRGAPGDDGARRDAPPPRARAARRGREASQARGRRRGHGRLPHRALRGPPGAVPEPAGGARHARAARAARLPGGARGADAPHRGVHQRDQGGRGGEPAPPDGVPPGPGAALTDPRPCLGSERKRACGVRWVVRRSCRGRRSRRGKRRGLGQRTYVAPQGPVVSKGASRSGKSAAPALPAAARRQPCPPGSTLAVRPRAETESRVGIVNERRRLPRAAWRSSASTISRSTSAG